MYDSTLALTRIRGLVSKIEQMMADPQDNVLYFVTGEYAADSYQLILLVKELDEFLTKNTNNGDRILPLWWEPKDRLKLRVEETDKYAEYGTFLDGLPPVKEPKLKG